MAFFESVASTDGGVPVGERACLCQLSGQLAVFLELAPRGYCALWGHYAPPGIHCLCSGTEHRRLGVAIEQPASTGKRMGGTIPVPALGGILLLLGT